MDKVVKVNLRLCDQLLTLTGPKQDLVAFLDQLSWKIAIIRRQMTVEKKTKSRANGGENND